MSFMLLGILNSQAAGGGGAPAYELIETVTLANNTTQTVTFSSIPTDYKHLQVRASVQTTNSNSADETMQLNINGNFTSVYRQHMLRGSGSSVTSAVYSQRARIDISNVDTTRFGSISFQPSVIDFLDYANTSKTTTVRALFGNKGQNTSHIVLQSALYNVTDAVSSLTFTASFSGYSFVAGSRLSLYGVKG